MEKKHPNWWKNEEDEGGKNMHEKHFRSQSNASWKKHQMELQQDHQSGGRKKNLMINLTTFKIVI